MLIDSHCHIHDFDTYKFAISRAQGKARPIPEDYTPEKLLARAQENGIDKLICVGTSHEDSLKACDFAGQHENVFWSYGIHPDEATMDNNERASNPWRSICCNFDMGGASRGTPCARSAEGTSTLGDDSRQDPLSKLQQPPQAIGEIGLDYHNGTSTKEAQLKLLEQMLDLAIKSDLPCIFHVREAFDDFFAVLRNFPEIKRAVIHSFSDSRENLEKCLNEDFYIGVNGLATFTNIPLAPLERTLLETDSPFLAPVPHRGEVDEPAFVRNIANFLAIHYQTTLENVAKITTENAERLFKI